MSQLFVDCLNEIFKYLEEDTLRSCLLVNRFWCEVTVRILWRKIRNYNTLITCLPNESKEILHKEGIITSTSVSKPSMFNYALYCKDLSVYQVISKIEKMFINQQISSTQNSNYKLYTTLEILKLLINQASLKKLQFNSLTNIPIFTFPEAKYCLKNLTELSCNSDICPEFFYQSSQICHNIQSLSITFVKVISNGLVDLISAQKNLKFLNVVQFYNCEGLKEDIITSITNHPNTLIKLDLYGGIRHIPLSFIAKLTNLQEMMLSFDYQNLFKDFKELQYVTFPQLQILKLQCKCPRNKLLINFLENNGKNLREFYATSNNDSLNLAIANFCPNLRKLFTGIKKDELETLKVIFNSCQYLESFKIWCCGDYLNEKELFDAFIKYSPKNFHELKLCYLSETESELLSEELESFFISWTNRIPQKSLSLIIFCNNSNTLVKIDGNMEIIEKFIRLGIIKEFKTIGHYFDDDFIIDE